MGEKKEMKIKIKTSYGEFELYCSTYVSKIVITDVVGPLHCLYLSDSHLERGKKEKDHGM